MKDSRRPETVFGRHDKNKHQGGSLQFSVVGKTHRQSNLVREYTDIKQRTR